MKLNFILIFTLLLIPACKSKVIHGKVINPQIIEKLRHANKEQVKKLVGEPSLIADGKWYYIYTISEQRAFLAPKLVKEEAVIINFSKDHVSDVNSIDKSEDIKNIKVQKDIEKTKGFVPNKFQEVVYNLQRFKANPRHKF